MPKLLIALGATSGFLAVALGAFGAHGLASRVTPERLEVFKTGATYQLTHALALVALGALGLALSVRGEAFPKSLHVAGYAFIAGSVIFSGSLYALVLSDVRAWGAVTPIGGVLFLVGWAALAFWAWAALH